MFQITRVVALITLASIAPSLSAQTEESETFKLLSPDGGAYQYFGASVATTPDVTIVGELGAVADGKFSGAAHLFDVASGSLIATLTPDDPRDNLLFGNSVAIDGDLAVIGAPGEDGAGLSTGAAYIFDVNLGVQLFKLALPDGEAFDEFGRAVAISGNTVLVGAPSRDGGGTWPGVVYVFDAQTGQQLGALLPSDLVGSGNFGWSIAAWQDKAVIGLPGTGPVCVFDLGTLQQIAELTPANGDTGDRFGWSVAIEGDVVAVGVPSWDDPGSDAGLVYQFDLASGQQVREIAPDDLVAGDQFGWSVALEGGELLAGAWRADRGGSDTGAAYRFDTATGVRLSRLVPTDAQAGDTLGWSVGAAGPAVVVSARWDDDNGDDSGSAYLFVNDPDTDGDGLLDSWETNGIPFTAADGSERRYILDVDGDGVSDADPMHKDLFVELDMMTGLTFPQDSVDMVVDAFWAAPVANPDTIDGIDLHIVVDENTIEFEEVSPTPGSDWPADAGAIKELYFGTLVEQFDPDEQALLAAKAKAYRYCILYNSASTGIGGLGEVGGDDLVIFAGRYSDENKAAVFMHELGHNLNLRHGGSDSVNMKPNYPSIMNYVHSYRETWNNTTWRLDFSRERLATINEGDLDEPVSFGLGGSGFYAEFLVPYYGVLPEESCLPGEAGTPRVSFTLLDPASGGQDLDLDCDRDGTRLEVDLNYLDDADLPGTGTHSPGELLVGHDDWANIVLPVSDGGGAFAGTAPTDELTNAQREWMRDNFPRPCTADWNVDAVVNTIDFLAYLNDWTAGKGAADLNADGVVNTQDFLVFLNDWVAGC